MEKDVLDITTSSVTLYHESLVSTICVDVLIDNVFNRGVRAKRADCRAARLVAPDVFYEEVGRGAFDRNTLVPICDFNVVNPVVVA